MKALRYGCWLASMAIAGCASTAPYAELTAERVAQADSFEADISILGIDGTLDPRGSSRITVEPGFHSVLLASDRKDRRGRQSTGAFPFTAKACMRYYLVARHETMSDADSWAPVLMRVEPIPECVAKFPDAAVK